MSSSSRAIVLKSSDGETFEMKEAEAQLSAVIKRMIEVDCAKSCIPITKVTGYILSRIIHYCRKHVNTADDDGALTSFDREFIDVDDATLLQLANAAIFLEIKSLSALSCQALADMIKEKSVEEIRERFKIKNEDDETPYDGETESDFNEMLSDVETEWGFDETPAAAESELGV